MGHIAGLPYDGPQQYPSVMHLKEKEKRRYNKLKGRIKWNIKKKLRHRPKGVSRKTPEKEPRYMATCLICELRSIVIYRKCPGAAPPA
jgi:hypothetical protein